MSYHCGVPNLKLCRGAVGEPPRADDELYRARVDHRSGQASFGREPAGERGRPRRLWQDAPGNRSGRQTTAAPTEGLCFVDLSGLVSPDLVPGSVLRALGLPETPGGTSPLDTLTAQLAERELLVILDNCEHLLEACAALADALGRRCPGVRLLAISRERLGVPGETVIDLGGLELPEPEGAPGEGWLAPHAGPPLGHRPLHDRAGYQVLDRNWTKGPLNDALAGQR